MAGKIRVGRSVCLECGEDLIPAHCECPRCGTNVPREETVVAQEYIEDAPIRASHISWMDGLLCTGMWYVPVIPIALSVVVFIVASLSGISYTLAIVTFAMAIIFLAAWLYHGLDTDTNL